MTQTQGWIRSAVAMLVLTGSVTAASAQTEDVEPRIIGERGVTLLGLSGSLSRFFSSEALMAGTYTVQADGHRFVTSKIAIRFGVVGSDAFGGDSDEDDDEDEDAAVTTPNTALEALGGAVYYLTPASIWSFYGGGEYRARITNRETDDIGSANAIVGLQGALSSRASFFVEGGYGFRLRRGDEGELQTRIVGQAGVRFRF
jgi:hypothetical protein